MRRLTVKNFSVIKEAELEFGKITVLIGPQASGKSLLCKLAYFLGREVIRIAIDLVVNQITFSEFESSAQQEFTKWFPNGGWGGDGNWSITFTSDAYGVTFSSAASGSSNAATSFSPEFEQAYVQRLDATREEHKRRGFLIGPALQSLAATALLEVAGRGVWDASTYIPLERSYFVDTKKGYRSLAAESDPISAQFADVFANSLNPTSPKFRISKYLKGNLVPWQNDWMLSFNDGRFLPLSHLSSGGKETLPIIAALDYYEHQRSNAGNLVSADLYGHNLYSFDDFTIEEPEASIFPQTQYELVQEFVGLSGRVDFQPHFTITTHSPYILTAFNNLIEAGQVARAKPELKEDVAKLIPEQYWIKEGDFKAYAIEDGVLKSIVAEDTCLISTNYLDSVSETIGVEFDELLRLGYVES